MSLDEETSKLQESEEVMKFWQIEIEPHLFTYKDEFKNFIKEFIPSETRSSDIQAYSRIDFYGNRNGGHYFLTKSSELAYAFKKRVIDKAGEDSYIVNGVWIKEVEIPRYSE